MKIEKIRLQEHPFFGTMEFDFTGPDGKALDNVVIAGINGSGKTTLLETIFFILTTDDVSYSVKFGYILDLTQSNFDKGVIVYDHIPEGSSPKYLEYEFEEIEVSSRPKLIYMPTEINFDGLKTRTVSFKKDYQFKNVVDRSAIEDVPSFIASYVNGEVFKNPDLPARAAIEKVCGEINALFDILEIDARLVGLAAEEKSPVFENSAGKTFDINKLSSGEKQLFIRALSLKMLNANNSVILIDEPEISLHPAWQQKIMKVYQEIGENNQVIAATHSPHVVASVKKESVRLLKRKQGKIEMTGYQDIDAALGLPVDIVLRELMELDTTRDPVVAGEIKNLWEMVHARRFDEESFKKGYDKLENLLGSEDEELLLMRVEIARLKAEKDKVHAGNQEG